jgi:hypothetical protein
VGGGSPRSRRATVTFRGHDVVGSLGRRIAGTVLGLSADEATFRRRGFRAGNPAAQTALACEVFWGLGAGEAAAVTDDALEGLSPDGAGVPAYEAWRARIRSRFITELVRP